MYKSVQSSTQGDRLGVCVSLVCMCNPPPTHLDISKGAPPRLSKSLSDQFPVRVCSFSLWVKSYANPKPSV